MSDSPVEAPAFEELVANAVQHFDATGICARWRRGCTDDLTLGPISDLPTELTSVQLFLTALEFEQPFLDFDDEDEFVETVTNMAGAPSSAGLAVRLIALLGDAIAHDASAADSAVDKEILRRVRATVARATVYVMSRALGDLDAERHLDELTGLPNKRSWLRDTARAVQHADTGSDMLTVVLADLDGLKEVNDTKGHPAGDAYIKQFGLYFAQSVGARGSVYRWGGDEYSALLFLSADDAAALMAAVEASSPAPMSWGTATYVAGTDITALETVADGRLYAMKEEHKRGRGTMV